MNRNWVKVFIMGELVIYFSGALAAAAFDPFAWPDVIRHVCAVGLITVAVIAGMSEVA